MLIALHADSYFSIINVTECMALLAFSLQLRELLRKLVGPLRKSIVVATFMADVFCVRPGYVIQFVHDFCEKHQTEFLRVDLFFTWNVFFHAFGLIFSVDVGDSRVLYGQANFLSTCELSTHSLYIFIGVYLLWPMRAGCLFMTVQ